MSSSLNLNSDKQIAPYQIEGNDIKISQTYESGQNQNSVYKIIKNDFKSDNSYNYAEISPENN